MSIREKFADFIGEYLTENGANREKYGISTEHHISDDVIVHWIRRSSIHKEWCFKTVHKDRISKKNTQFVAFVYDLEECPEMIYCFDMIPDPTDRMKSKLINRRKKKIDNHTHFKRGSFLIEIDWA